MSAAHSTTPHRFVCLVCNREFDRQSKRGPKPSYCGLECRRSANYQSRRTAKECLVCGKGFLGIAPARCCSRRCYLHADLDLVCRLCNKPFRGKRGRFYCDDCPPIVSLECEECGLVFEGRSGIRYCSRRCNARVICRERKARLRTLFVESFSLAEIAGRDGGMCQLCGGPVNFSVVAPDPMSPSIDHKIPVSKGGEHSRANCQLAHLGCNSSKNDRDMTQWVNEARNLPRLT